MAAADNFDAVFTFDNLYHSYKKCCLGVGWKASTQRYRVNAIVNVNDTLRQLKEGKFKSLTRLYELNAAKKEISKAYT